MPISLLTLWQVIVFFNQLCDHEIEDTMSNCLEKNPISQKSSLVQLTNWLVIWWLKLLLVSTWTLLPWIFSSTIQNECKNVPVSLTLPNVKVWKVIVFYFINLETLLTLYIPTLCKFCSASILFKPHHHIQSGWHLTEKQQSNIQPGISIYPSSTLEIELTVCLYQLRTVKYINYASAYLQTSRVGEAIRIYTFIYANNSGISNYSRNGGEYDALKLPFAKLPLCLLTRWF